VPTQCSDRDFLFEPLPGRPVVARFDGGTLTSDEHPPPRGVFARGCGHLRPGAAPAGGGDG
jgi:hypothetical protein